MDGSIGKRAGQGCAGAGGIPIACDTATTPSCRFTALSFGRCSPVSGAMPSTSPPSPFNRSERQQACVPDATLRSRSNPTRFANTQRRPSAQFQDVRHRTSWALSTTISREMR